MSDGRWSELYPQDVDERKLGIFGRKPVQEKKPISVVLPCWRGDQHQAIWLLEWMGQLGFTQAALYLCCSRDCEVERMLALARKAFSRVEYIPDGEAMVSNWHEPGHHPKSAGGPNSLFRQIAWHFSVPEPKGPWLFLEPDAVPCRPDWYDLISREYEVGGKPFMGFHVNPQNHTGVPPHLSGVAVYPENTPSLAQRAVEVSEVAFDIAGVDDILPKAFFTSLIFHKYRAESFESQEDFEKRVPRNLAIYHSCKDGSIYQFLRARHGIKGGDQNCISPKTANVISQTESISRTVQSTEITLSNGAGSSTPHAPTPFPGIDVFIKTRVHDYPWLEWCLKSVAKHERGLCSIIVAHDSKENPPELPWANGRWVPIPEKEPGYLWQQVCKLHADEMTDAEYILFTDSDTIFTRPVSPSDFIRDGKPTWRYTPLDQARPDQHHWIGVMEKFLGKKPEHEFMREHPHIVPRWALEEFRRFCQYRHGKSIEDYIMGEAVPGSPTALVFSEWNCLGFFLWEFHRDRIHWLSDSEGHNCTYQGHTHSGEQRKQEDLAKFREILEGSTPLVGRAEPEGVSPSPVLTEEEALKVLAGLYKGKSPLEKARMAKKLKMAWK